MGSFGEWVAGKIGGTIGDEIGKDLQPVLPPNDTGNVVHDGLVKDGELLGPAIGGLGPEPSWVLNSGASAAYQELSLVPQQEQLEVASPGYWREVGLATLPRKA
ncbi:hypothetical protein CWS35_16015 [Bradyrhizobium sp. SK17]|uniref:hypothetical protein n=1 Tax=Bradyrhizobium sp. SK17 TaxID=2057741 RepID=UPI000C315FF4|nr:hypothetical protein [Bradyrhizobium sp. SK17]AUC95569.1 hypothetical protein CWS35_16015 [Bradyrhizobium sp. SK17]